MLRSIRDSVSQWPSSIQKSRREEIIALKIHTRIVHQPRKNAKHHCSLCVACFNTQGNLLRHFLSVHQELRRFICGLCGSRYSQNQVLRRHLLQVHQVQIDSISSFDKKSVSEMLYYLYHQYTNPSPPPLSYLVDGQLWQDSQHTANWSQFVRATMQLWACALDFVCYEKVLHNSMEHLE
uniref:C2H2-type domain-containing protein n=1 Tax=Timema monikensis TaxID=170555 RepID=A0A7R9EHV1_9NEOP|nr:unnamed protein product [Timema monikensis]